MKPHTAPRIPAIRPGIAGAIAAILFLPPLTTLAPTLRAQTITVSGTGQTIVAVPAVGSTNSLYKDTSADYIVNDGATLTIINDGQMGTGANGSIFSATTGVHFSASVTGNNTGYIIFDGKASQNTPTFSVTGRSGGAFYMAAGANTLTITGGTTATGQVTGTIQNYWGTGIQNGGSGGVVYMNTGANRLVWTNLTAANNGVNGGYLAAGTRAFGGVIAAQAGASLTLTNVTFNNNLASAGNNRAYGGAIYLATSTMTMNGGSFTGNSAAGGTDTNALGGAIMMELASTATLTNVNFTNNTASGNGGGAILVADASTLTINGGAFTGNVALAMAGSGNGGAILGRADGTTVNLINVIFTSNTANATGLGTQGRGGAIYAFTGNYNLTYTQDATMLGNAAIATGPSAAGPSAANGGFLYAASTSVINIHTASNATLTIGSAANVNADTIFSATSAQLNFNPGATDTGVIVLHGNSAASASPVTVGAGKLILGNALAALGSGTSTITVKSGATLGGIGTLGTTGTSGLGSAVAINGGKLQIGLAGTTGQTLAITNNLNLATGSILDYTDLDNQLIIGGTLGLAGMITINFTTGATGTYSLINMASGFGNSGITDTTLAGNFYLTYNNKLLGTSLYTLGIDTTDKYLYLILNDLPPPATCNVLTWTGATGGAWSAANWQTSLNPDATFTQGDIVNLAGAPAPANTINIDTPAGATTVAAMYVSGTQSYTITGAGITGDIEAGDGKLILGAVAADDATATVTAAAFTGTLTLANAANNFAGGIVINSGALIGDAQTLGSGVTGITNNGVLTFHQTASGTYAAPIKGAGTLNFTGPGTLTLPNANPEFAGAVNVNATVTAANTGALGAAAVDIGTTGALTYAAAGTLANNITGNGALNLAGTTGPIIITGTNTVKTINALAGANIIAASAKALNSTALALTAATVTLTQDATALGAVTMHGASRLAIDSAIPTGTATLASLTSTGAGATLAFNTNIGAGTANTLVIAGAITGTYNITINNTGGKPAAATTTIPLIKAATTNATYLGGGTLVFPDALNTYTYTYTITPAGGATLEIQSTKTISPNASAILTAASGVQTLAWFAELDTLHQRLGDLHNDTRAEPGANLWLRGRAQRLNINDKDTLVPFREDQYGAQVGIDYGGHYPGHTYAAYGGLYLGSGRSTRTNNTLDATGDTSSYNAGLYLAIMRPDGWYLDLVGKYNTFRNTYAASHQNITVNGAYSNYALGGSAELGKLIALGKNWQVTPSFQAGGAHISRTFYNASSTTGAAKPASIRVALGSVSTRQLRAGARLAYKHITKDNAQILQPHVKFDIANQWTDGGATAVNGIIYGSPLIKGTRIDAGAGLTWQMANAGSKNVQVYIEYESAWAKDYKQPYGLNLGISHRW